MCRIFGDIRSVRQRGPKMPSPQRAAETQNQQAWRNYTNHNGVAFQVSKSGRPRPKASARDKNRMTTTCRDKLSERDAQLNEILLANRAADRRRLKAQVLDSVPSPITKRSA